MIHLALIKRFLFRSLGQRIASVALVVFVFAPAAAFAGSGMQSNRACRLDSADTVVVQQAAAAASVACNGSVTAGDAAACQTAQAQWRGTVRDLCASDPCTLSMPSVEIIENRVTAESIEDFLQVAADISSTGGGEIGSFRWMVNANSGGYGGRLVRLTAQGTMTLPVEMPSNLPPADQALVFKAMRMIQRHETRHRDAFYAVARKACAAMSRRTGDTEDILRSYFCGTGPGTNAAEQQKVDLLDGETKLVAYTDGTKGVEARGTWHDVNSYITVGLCN